MLLRCQPCKPYEEDIAHDVYKISKLATCVASACMEDKGGNVFAPDDDWPVLPNTPPLCTAKNVA